MKEFGMNHIRSSHNPYSEDFLKLCDKYGILVVDELYDFIVASLGWWNENFTSRVVSLGCDLADTGLWCGIGACFGFGWHSRK